MDKMVPIDFSAVKVAGTVEIPYSAVKAMVIHPECEKSGV
jgi:hypothetical protein